MVRNAILTLVVAWPCTIWGFMSQTSSFQQRSLSPSLSWYLSEQNRDVWSSSSTVLFGAFNRGNKQADLMKKMELAKNARQKGGSEGGSEDKKLTDEEIKQINDRKRFEQLLDRESASVNTDYSSSGNSYLTKEQEEEEIVASERGVDRLFEGDPAPTDPFQDLLSMTSENALSKKGTKRVIPWLNQNPAKQKDYLIVISDPRLKSSAFRKSLAKLISSLSPDMKKRMIFINADTPAENRRWLKKQGMEGNVDIYSDEKREWMKAYTALGEKRWEICMFVLANGRVQKIVRDLDTDMCVDVVDKAVKSLNI
eukprot:CAMPEP_0197833448 /NCGR_PEP_ID=MMETSP1437-20131217/19079_1 /TAXON_ID=49252 ORGANISM="Eucampia antarctica, Strain CCMP1452" /NCGR_SAMPLE_ID=MMETSP1437 /ASSEMBLY_ACC=CAM_ASM_001096 /LENGTH=310 /DNA_ID=CAMNT_0043437519 /DNA_START=47 /DNA_END=979 /DNA_ORIENTATION=-